MLYRKPSRIDCIRFIYALGVLFALACLAPFAQVHSAIAAADCRLAQSGAPATRLYDGALGTMPQQQGWAYGGLPLGALPTPTIGGGATTLTTTAALTIQAGFSAARGGFLGSTAPVPELSRTQGFTVTFRVQVQGETHSGNDRAGFSVIVLASDRRGIELGFWQNEIWAQEGGTSKLFTHAEGATFDTTSALTTYELVVQGDAYRLLSGGQQVLAGAVRDYTAFSGPINPYTTPNYLFFGDNTTSAAAVMRLALIEVAVAQPAGRVFVPLARS